MAIVNMHRRIISQPKERIIALMATLSTKDDKIWPIGKWPKMKFEKGIQLNAEGGHGPIRYKVKEYVKGQKVEFEFMRPIGFKGVHGFEINAKSECKTEIIHYIKMRAVGFDRLKWYLVIRWLHDALIEDAFDNIENQFGESSEKTKWNLWVRLLRWLLK